MQNVNSAFHVCRNSILKWSSNNRIVMLYILLLIVVYFYSKGLINFSNETSYNIVPCTFPFLLNSRLCKYLIMMGVVILFYDAPFVDENEKYIVIRSSKKNWVVGHVMYIMLATAIYFLMITLFSIIVLLPNVFFSNSWGKLISTAALNPMSSTPLYIDYTILEIYTPTCAYLTSFFLNWCAGTVIGLSMFLINVYLKPYMGVIAAFVIISMDVLFDPSAILTLPNQYIYISPLTLTNLRMIDYTQLGTTPSLLTVIIYFSALIVVLSGLIIRYVPKADLYN